MLEDGTKVYSRVNLIKENTKSTLGDYSHAAISTSYYGIMPLIIM